MHRKFKSYIIHTAYVILTISLLSSCTITKQIIPKFNLEASKINSDSLKITWSVPETSDHNIYYQILRTNPITGIAKTIKGSVFEIYLNTKWETPHIHYGGLYGWTNPPGKKMEKVVSAIPQELVNNSPVDHKNKGWFKYTIHDSPFTSVTFNDGDKIWDNNNGRNYTLNRSGIYRKIDNGTIEKVADRPSKGFKGNKYLDYSISPSSEYIYQVIAYNNEGYIIAESNILTLKSLKKEISIYPYLTWNDPDNSISNIIINFQTSEPRPVVIEYGTEKNKLDMRVKGVTSKIHHIELHDLKSDTMYWYRICTDELKDHLFNFKTAKLNTYKFSFIILNDMQDGVDYNTPPRRWADIAHEVKKIMKKERISFIIAPGDLISNDSNINWKIFFDKGKDLLPYVVIMPVPGNHETAGDESHDRNSSNYYGERNFKQYFDLPYKKSYYYFIYGNSLFIGLDTEILSEIDTMMQSKQYLWMVNILKRYSRIQEWIFVYQHIPPYSESQRHTEQCLGVRPLTKYFDGFVDWNFAAHMHNYQRFNPIRYNSKNPNNPIIEKEYGREKNQGVGYINLAPSGNKPEKLAKDSKKRLAFPTLEDIKNGTFSEIGFTKVDINKHEISITTYALGDLTNKKELHVYDKISYSKSPFRMQNLHEKIFQIKVINVNRAHPACWLSSWKLELH